MKEHLGSGPLQQKPEDRKENRLITFWDSGGVTCPKVTIPCLEAAVVSACLQSWGPEWRELWHSQVLNHKGGFSPIAGLRRATCEVLWSARSLHPGPKTSLGSNASFIKVLTPRPGAGPLTSLCFPHLQNNAYLEGLFQRLKTVFVRASCMIHGSW